jgi:hypothetical protein
MEKVLAFTRALGVSVEQLQVSLCDLASPHESKEMLAMFRTGNVTQHYGVPHATQWWQLQDGQPYTTLKTTSRQCFDLYNQLFKRHGKVPGLEDFPFVMQHAYNQYKNETMITNALESKGYFPWNPDNVLKDMREAKPYAVYLQQFEAEAGGAEQDDSEQPAGEGMEDGEDQLTQEAAWECIGSDPTANRSPKKEGLQVRLRGRPNAVTFDVTLGLFEFQRQETVRKIFALISELDVVEDAVAKKKQRGKAIGKKDLVFLADDVADAKEENAKKKQEKKEREKSKVDKAKQRAKEQRELFNTRHEKLKVANKLIASLRKEIAGLKKENRVLAAGTGKRPKQKAKAGADDAEDDSEEESEEAAEESEESEEDSEEQSEAQEKQGKDPTSESEEESSENEESNEEEQEAPLEECVPPGWEVVRTAPAASFTEDKFAGKCVLYRFESPARWYPGRVMKKSEKGRKKLTKKDEEVGLNVTVQYTTAFAGFSANVKTKLDRTGYGEEARWVLLSKVRA